MKNIFQKDKKKRNLVCKTEMEKLILKNISNNENYTELCKSKSFMKISNYEKKNCYSTRISNFCIDSKRKKKISKFYRFNRLTLLRFLRSGNIYGFKKASW